MASDAKADAAAAIAAGAVARHIPPGALQSLNAPEPEPKPKRDDSDARLLATYWERAQN